MDSGLYVSKQSRAWKFEGKNQMFEGTTLEVEYLIKSRGVMFENAPKTPSNQLRGDGCTASDSIYYPFYSDLLSNTIYDINHRLIHDQSHYHHRASLLLKSLQRMALLN